MPAQLLFHWDLRMQFPSRRTFRVIPVKASTPPRISFLCLSAVALSQRKENTAANCPPVTEDKCCFPTSVLSEINQSLLRGPQIGNGPCCGNRENQICELGGSVSQRIHTGLVIPRPIVLLTEVLREARWMICGRASWQFGPNRWFLNKGSGSVWFLTHYLMTLSSRHVTWLSNPQFPQVL